MPKPALLISLNPAIDSFAELECLHIGDVNRLGHNQQQAAGKAVNVAKVLRALGQPVELLGFFGEQNYQIFAQLFTQLDIHSYPQLVSGSTRTNLKLLSQQQGVTELNFAGFDVNPTQVAHLQQQLMTLTSKQHYTAVVCAGSLPTGVSCDDFANWLSQLRAQGQRVVVDTSGAALNAALHCQPWLVKPNLSELEACMGYALTSLEMQCQAVHQLLAQGIEHVVISKGAAGLLYGHGKQIWQLSPPKVQVHSTVGAGDTLVAALVYALNQSWPQPQQLRFACALASYAVTQPSVGDYHPAQVAALAQQVQLQQLTA